MAHRRIDIFRDGRHIAYTVDARTCREAVKGWYKMFGNKNGHITAAFANSPQGRLKHKRKWP